MNSWLDEKDEWEGIKGFPQNRTLYIDQFSEGNPLTSNVFDSFQAQDMESVFEHFQPVKEVELRNESGEYVIELFPFRSIDDFEDEQIIERSELLAAERDKIDTYNDMIRQIERNKALRNMLSDENTYTDIKNCIASLIAELAQKKALDNSIQQEDYLLLKGIIKHVEFMDPSRAAAKNIFLSDSFYADTRQKLTNDLKLWASILEGRPDLAKMVEACRASRNEAELNLQSNLFQIHEDTRALEVTYRTLESFFANAGQESEQCLFLMSVNIDDMRSSDSDGSIAIQKELKRHYDTLSLRNSYSLFVVPGYLGDAPTIREWAKLARRNKVLMVTDFKDCTSFKILEDELEETNLQSSDLYLSNAVVTCNYLLGRKKSELANEDDDVYIPGSAALAGRMANTKEIVIAQGVVGKDFGLLDEVQGTRLKLLKSEIAALIDQGVVPMVENEGRTYALSNRTLYHGSAFSLQEYPIVRVLDWVNKVLMNYIHEIANENWDQYNSPPKLEKRIREFLDHYRGYQLLFASYKLGDPKQDPKSKIVTVDISITPFFATKNLIIKLEADNKNYMSADVSEDRQT